MKVLVVEDNPEVIESLKILFELRWAEVTVISATKGRNGIELAKTNSPDVAIVDLGLPDLDGFEVLRHIRNFSDMPIVILTARHEEIDQLKARELGADDYITKPFSPSELLARIKSVLSGRHMPEERKACEKSLVRVKL